MAKTRKLPAPERDPVIVRTPTGPLSPKMREVLVAMFYGQDNLGYYGMTGNEIGSAVGHRQGDVKSHTGGAKKYSGVRSMGAAQKVIPVLIALDRRGLIRMATRQDGRAGTAYRLTDSGEKEARKIMSEQAQEKGYRTDLATADGDDVAVWIVEGYDPENLEPVKAGECSFKPGDLLSFPEDHDVYPGEEGVVQAVGMGTGMREGEVLYDVLVEGTSDVERVSEYELEAS